MTRQCPRPTTLCFMYNSTETSSGQKRKGIGEETRGDERGQEGRRREERRREGTRGEEIIFMDQIITCKDIETDM